MFSERPDNSLSHFITIYHNLSQSWSLQIKTYNLQVVLLKKLILYYQKVRKFSLLFESKLAWKVYFTPVLNKENPHEIYIP